MTAVNLYRHYNEIINEIITIIHNQKLEVLFQSYYYMLNRKPKQGIHLIILVYRVWN